MQVYKGKMGALDVAVKTINRERVDPRLTIAALRVMEKVCMPPAVCRLAKCMCDMVCKWVMPGGLTCMRRTSRKADIDCHSFCQAGGLRGS